MVNVSSAASRSGRGGDVVFLPVTHGLIGWAIAHIVPSDRRTRLWCVLASLAPDVDGVSMAFGFEAYVRYHHVFTHNLLFGAMVTLLSAVWVGARAGPLGLVFAAYLSHLVGDYFGSGPGYGLWPFLPFSNAYIACPCGWPVVWWINLVATVGVVVLALGIAVRCGRTPLEFVHSGLEQAVVSKLRLAPCHRCPSGAALRCRKCRRPVCRRHVAIWRRLRPLCGDCAG